MEEKGKLKVVLKGKSKKGVKLAKKVFYRLKNDFCFYRRKWG
jgi:hypothetical protein